MDNIVAAHTLTTPKEAFSAALLPAAFPMVPTLDNAAIGVFHPFEAQMKTLATHSVECAAGGGAAASGDAARRRRALEGKSTLADGDLEARTSKAQTVATRKRARWISHEDAFENSPPNRTIRATEQPESRLKTCGAAGDLVFPEAAASATVFLSSACDGAPFELRLRPAAAASPSATSLISPVASQSQTTPMPALVATPVPTLLATPQAAHVATPMVPALVSTPVADAFFTPLSARAAAPPSLLPPATTPARLLRHSSPIHSSPIRPFSLHASPHHSRSAASSTTTQLLSLHCLSPHLLPPPPSTAHTPISSAAAQTTQSTPQGDEFRIPEILSCPGTPQKAVFPRGLRLAGSRDVMTIGASPQAHGAVVRERGRGACKERRTEGWCKEEQEGRVWGRTR